MPARFLFGLFVLVERHVHFVHAAVGLDDLHDFVAVFNPIPVCIYICWISSNTNFQSI